ncbi:Transcription initiation factor TFIID subunit 12 [Seiridium cupressi]
MNTQSQGQPGPAQAQAMRIPMYRPEQMRSLEILSDSDKEKYERGLKGLWDTMENNPPDSAAHKQAKSKISEFSRGVWGKVTTMRRQQAQAQAAQAGQGQPGQPGQPNAIQANIATQRANMAQARPTPAMNGGGAAAPAQAGQQRTAAGNNLPQVSQSVLQMVNSLKVIPPVELSNDHERAQKYRSDLKTKYMKALALVEQNQKKIVHMQALVKDRTSKGQQFSPEEQNRLNSEMEQCRKMCAEGKRFADSVKAQASQGQPDSAGTPAGQNVGQPARPQQVANTGNPMQAATASVNAAMDAAKNLQSTAANRQPGAPQTPTTSGVMGSTVQTTTAPATQAQAAPAAQPQVKIEPGFQHPPPVNTVLAAATANTGTSAGTPTQNSARVQTPQAATPITAGQGAARPLTHQSALALANKTNSSNSVPTLNQQGLSAAASANTPGSAGIANTAQAAHSHAHPQHPGAQHPGGAVPAPKMPIPKQLPDRAQQIPQAVATGGGVNAGRPTLGNGLGTAGGTMNQPVIQKNPAFTFEAEGEHVLNKKKLDELVRQVCGGGPPGQDGNYLTPDVEESVNQVADHFVDNVLYQACRLAKERGSKVLEIRDLQLVLERVYNIRVAGFTSDELRTVRKPQPNGAWLSKEDRPDTGAVAGRGSKQAKTKVPVVDRSHGMAFAKVRPLGGMQARDWVKKNGPVMTNVRGTDAKSVWGRYNTSTAPPDPLTTRLLPIHSEANRLTTMCGMPPIGMRLPPWSVLSNGPRATPVNHNAAAAGCDMNASATSPEDLGYGIATIAARTDT